MFWLLMKITIFIVSNSGTRSLLWRSHLMVNDRTSLGFRVLVSVLEIRFILCLLLFYVWMGKA